MEPNLRFIHSADLHLDSPFSSKGHLPEQLIHQMRSSTFEAYERLINLAIHLDVDFVLISGDLFNEETRSLKSQVYLRNGFEKLKREGIEVYVSHGNHDYLQGASYPITYPENVHVFNAQHVTAIPFYKKEKHIANIYGFSYVEKEIKTSKVPEYQKEGHPYYHIAMLHGSLESNSEHQTYAPFRMEDLYQMNMDYWALGHIHKRQILSEDPPVIYPGNIQGRSRKESGDKGCYVVEWTNGEKSQYFVQLHSFTYESLTIPCDHLSTPNQLESIFQEAKLEIEKKYDHSVILKLELTARTGNLKRWDLEGLITDWIQVVNEAEEFDCKWVWIDTVQINDQPSWDEKELIKGQHFTGELLRELQDLNENDIERMVSSLYRHRRASKYLDELSEKEIKDMVEQAKHITVDQLLSQEGY